MALSTVRRAAFVTLDLQPLICSFMDDGQRDALVSRVNNAFTTTGLASWVSAHQTTEMVVCGVATGLVVLKTAVHAIDQDLEVTVLSDLCADLDQRRHDACMDAVFPTLARVMPSDEWLAALGRPGGGGGPDGSPQKTAAGALRGLL